MLKEKRNFSIDEVEKECAYLDSKVGYLLESYNGDEYSFIEQSGDFEYAIHFTINELEKDDFKEYGYRYLFTYVGSRGGYYHYLVRDKSNANKYRDYEERIQAIQLLQNRLSRFTFVVVAGLLALFTYLFLKNGEIVYLLVLIPGVLLGVYSIMLQKRYKDFKLKYGKD